MNTSKLAKLSADDRLKAKQDWAKGTPLRQLAKRLSVSITTVWVLVKKQ